MMGNSGFYVGVAVAKIILLILNTLGNILVIQAILRFRRLRTASNYLVANLALCDLLSPLLNIPVDISVELAENSWHYGSAVCRLIWPLATLLTISSALTLVAISIDRSRALKHPFVTKLSSRQSLAVIFLIHCFSLVVVIPYSMASVVIDGKCDEDWSKSYFNPKQYTLVVFHVQYLLPLVILAFVYGKAARYLRRCTLSLVKLEGTSENQAFRNSRPTSSTLRRHRFHGKKSPSRSQTLKIRREQNARVVKMFAVVVAVFAIFTLPNNVRWLLTDFGNYSHYKHKHIISFICVMCTYANCLANPIIYGTLSKDYKNHFLHILTFGRCGRTHYNVNQRASRLHSTIRTAKRTLADCRSEMNAPENARTMV